MKILVTGGCGFIGTNLSVFLKKKDFKVHTLDNLSKKGSFYNFQILKSNKIKNFKIDISDFKKIQRLPKFDIIIDCCAEAAVEISKKNIQIGFKNIIQKE